MLNEAVRFYVQGLASYRILSTLMEHRVGRPISRSTLNGWVDQAGRMAMTPLEMSAGLAPHWGGFLGVDGKAVFVKGVEHALLVAVDQTTQDVVHALLVQAETEQAFYRLVREAVVLAGYPLKGLVTDASPPLDLWQLTPTIWPSFPSSCAGFISPATSTDIAKAKRSPDAALRAELKQRIRAVLFADTYQEAARLWPTLLDAAAHYQGLSRYDTLGSLRDRFQLYMTHHRIPGLPADANITENVIKQLGKKLRLIEGFQTVDSAERFIRLLVGCYRFKRFTDSDNGHNGKCPLEIAGIDLTGIDWLGYLLPGQ